jgi:hypothetical protein
MTEEEDIAHGAEIQQGREMRECRVNPARTVNGGSKKSFSHERYA